jgi:hypothetical protein
MGIGKHESGRESVGEWRVLLFKTRQARKKKRNMYRYGYLQ